jgi:uncharacterized protein YggE
VSAAILASMPQAALALDKVVTVTGEGVVSVAPDTATVRAGVVTQGKTAREATDANSRKMNALIEALKKGGIDARDIQTTRLTIQPMHENNRGPNAPITGFQTSNQVTVTLHEIGKLSALLDAVIAAGANDISGIDFMVADPSKALDGVRKAAVEDARRKAQIYATAAGGTLGRALAIEETSRGPIPYAKATMAVRAAPVPVSPGEETLRVAVTVTFALDQ